MRSWFKRLSAAGLLTLIIIFELTAFSLLAFRESALDFNHSTEYINNFRLRRIIVSAKVRKLFKEHKIYAQYIPVTILE